MKQYRLLDQICFVNQIIFSSIIDLPSFISIAPTPVPTPGPTPVPGSPTKGKIASNKLNTKVASTHPILFYQLRHQFLLLFPLLSPHLSPLLSPLLAPLLFPETPLLFQRHSLHHNRLLNQRHSLRDNRLLNQRHSQLLHQMVWLVQIIIHLLLHS